jgi:TetR/AcrR family transcriptional regulator, tetracycline repressor protein
MAAQGKRARVTAPGARARGASGAPAARSPGQRAGLTRAAVLTAARRIADRDGLEKLSMRALASELGVRPNAIYSHVAGKGELLDALLDSLLGEIQAPETEDWREALVAIMDDSRRLLVEHSSLIPEFLSRPTRGPNALRLGELCIELLARGGVEGELAARAFRSLLVHALGFAAYQAPRLQDPDRDARVARSEAFFSSSASLDVRDVSGELAQMPDREEFLASLDWMIDGALRRSRRPARRPRTAPGAGRPRTSSTRPPG